MTIPNAFDMAQMTQPVATLEAEPGTLNMDLLEEMHATLRKDREDVFDICHKYFNGDHLLPYAPRDATDQIKDLQQRSITNWIPLLVNLPSQVSFVDGYRRGTFGSTNEPDGSSKPAGNVDRFSPEYEEWQKNGFDARQAVVYRSALMYGHAFVRVNTRNPEKIKLEVLSTRNTVAYFEDPVNDVIPSHLLTIKYYARSEKLPGYAIFMDGENEYDLDITKEGEFKVREVIPNKRPHVPVVRYTCYIDDEGATMGVIRPIIPMQDRVNQAAFSTNITADFGAFKVRTAAGLQVSFKRDANGEPILDPETGRPIPEPVVVTQARMLVSGDPNTKFSQLDETPLAGYLANEDQATKNLAAIAQFPLHALMGNVSNLSAEALNSLEAQFMRFLQHLHTSWGESHEQLFRLISDALGDQAGSSSFGGEVRWRDMSSKAFSAMLDGLSKGVDSLGIPQRAAWALIPGVTSGDLADWEKLKEDEHHDMMLNAVDPVSASRREAVPAAKPAPKPAANGVK